MNSLLMNFMLHLFIQIEMSSIFEEIFLFYTLHIYLIEFETAIAYISFS